MYAYKLGFLFHQVKHEFKFMGYYSWLTYYSKDDNTKLVKLVTWI